MLGMMLELGAALLPLSLVFLSACASGSTPAPAPVDTDPATTNPGHDSTGSRPTPRPTPARTHRRDAEPSKPEPAKPEPALAAEAQAFLAAHDSHRAAVDPAPSTPLPAMRWSDELAAHARSVASQCRFEHSQTDYGENLSARTGTATPAEIVLDWVAEREHYDAKRNRCEPGEVCGHYTQVVWRESTELGCATVSCSSGSPFGGGDWAMTVCNYAPAGNYSGQRPY
jgi:pathogenesis-related protein 1